MLTDEKSGQKILRSIFNPTHHFVLLCLDFLAVRMALSENAVVGNFDNGELKSPPCHDDARCDATAK